MPVVSEWSIINELLLIIFCSLKSNRIMMCLQLSLNENCFSFTQHLNNDVSGTSRDDCDCFVSIT